MRSTFRPNSGRSTLIATLAVENRVMRAVNHAHTAFSELSSNAVASDDTPSDGHGGSLNHPKRNSQHVVLGLKSDAAAPAAKTGIGAMALTAMRALQDLIPFNTASGQWALAALLGCGPAATKLVR
jgi:hypothetical protein